MPKKLLTTLEQIKEAHTAGHLLEAKVVGRWMVVRELPSDESMKAGLDNLGIEWRILRRKVTP